MSDHTVRSQYGAPACAAVRPRSGMAVAGLALGIVAVLTSFVPIVNNMSFFMALVGVVLAAVGLTGCVRGRRSGKGMAIAGLVLNIVAVVAVLASQAAMSAALDEAQKTLEGPVAVEASQTGAPSSLSVGDAVTLTNGLVVTVEAVERSVRDYDGAAITGVLVSYRNNGTGDESFNMFDWKAQDAQGVVDTPTYSASGSDDLGSGTLVPGGSVRGTVYFEGEVVKALYYGSAFASGAAATWSLA